MLKETLHSPSREMPDKTVSTGTYVQVNHLVLTTCTGEHLDENIIELARVCLYAFFSV